MEISNETERREKVHAVVKRIPNLKRQVSLNPFDQRGRKHIVQGMPVKKEHKQG